MKQPGRKSAAAQEVRQVVALTAPHKVEPDSTLTADELAIWRAVVETKPAGWVTGDSAPLLESFCRCVATERWLAGRLAVLKAADPVDEGRIASVLKARERESRSAASIATKLRLTPQSRYQPSTAARMQDAQTAATDPATGRKRVKPWEDPITGRPYTN